MTSKVTTSTTDRKTEKQGRERETVTTTALIASSTRM